MDDKFEKMLTCGMKLKKVMLEKKLTRAKAKCPFCEGYLHGVLAGPKQHLHMHCDGCDMIMME